MRARTSPSKQRAQWNGPFQVAARPGKPVVRVEPTSGMGVCPVCGGGVKLVGWRSLAYLLDGPVLKSERVPRVGRHVAGGGPTRSRSAIACTGCYAVPEQVIL